MTISIQYQYQPDETRRPIDCSDNIEPIEMEQGEYMPIPAVGDTVVYQSYEYDDLPNGTTDLKSGREIMVARKVKTRHFSYHEGKLSYINIVVIDVPEGEMAMRLKQ